MPLRAAACLLLLAAPAQAFTLNILHTNDFHSRIEPINAYDSTCAPEEDAGGECFGGSARLKTAIDAARAEAAAAGEAVLVLDAGDQFAGSLLFTTYKGAAEAEMMNRIGYDAMALGNHEFDLGPQPAGAFVDAVAFPVLRGNIELRGENSLAGLAAGPVILEAGGERVGLVGALTPQTAEIASPGPTIGFADPAAALTAQVEALAAAGVEHIIAITHVGAPADFALAAAVPGLDAVVGGHSHSVFANAEGAAYAYPVMVEGPEGRAIPVVQAGAHGRYLGRLRLVFDDAGAVLAAEGDAQLLDGSVAPDPEIAARIEELAAPIAALKAEVMAELGGDVDQTACRAAECAMGNLVAEALLDRVRGQGVTIALQNGGGLRASLAAGPVTKGDVLSVLPFQNTLATFNLTGAGVIAALENGVSQYEEGAGRFPQVAGLRFTWDPRVPAMQGRIKEVLVAKDGDWTPIDPAAVYSVASNNFLRAGGDGYAILRDGATEAYDYGPPLEDVLEDYLAARPGYMPVVDGRVAQAE